MGAGWGCGDVGTFRALLPASARPLSWLSPVPLFKSRNDMLAHLFGDPTDQQRQRWVATQIEGGTDPELTERRYAGREHISFLVLGDTGEGDASQYCVVPGLLNQADGTDFTYIVSDVVYPAGGVNEYENKFYRPYQDYPAPIYAVPGNHDWYDGLHGFMRHFCGARVGPQHSAGKSRTGSLVKRAALRLLWREAPQPDEEKLRQMRALRGRPEQQGDQPASYFALEAGPLLLVGIDTGIMERLDHEQGAWLEWISRTSAKPKILLTGTPLYSDGTRRPVPIEGSHRTVDDIVRDREHNYLAAIGGDRHNYQRYPVRVGDGRTIQYIVSGGGGAFLHDTHLIPRVDLSGVDEDAFRCYPLRGDSLSLLSESYQQRLGWLLGNLYIPPGQAAALMAEHIGACPTRKGDREIEVSAATRRAYSKIIRLPQRFPGPLQEYVQRFFDRNDPPMFRSFLRIDAGDNDAAGEVAIRCFAATGCRAHEIDPPLEDSAECVRAGDGVWRWQD